MAISIIAVGDISFGDSPKCFGFGVKRVVENNGADFIFEKIKGHLNSDIVFGNLETVLSDEGLIPYDFYSDQMRGPAECVEALSRAGFNVLNIANNHMMQHGNAAFWDCIRRLKEKNITIVGLKGDGEYYSKPALMYIKENKVGILGYSFEPDNRFRRIADLEYAGCADLEIVHNDIVRLKNHVDFVVVSLHWGLEFALEPSHYLMETAHKIIDAGACIVLGHHSHIAQYVEKYRGGVVCYSLGNFVFDMVWNKRCMQSVIVRLDMSRNQIKLSTKPIRINRNFQPELVGEIQYISDDEESKTPKTEKKECIEYKKFIYYKKVAIEQLKDSIFSNFFLLLTLVTKTPIRFIPGKLSYIYKKFM